MRPDQEINQAIKTIQKTRLPRMTSQRSMNFAFQTAR